jgi:hypothetical protein
MAFDELLRESDSWVAASMARHAALRGCHLAKMLRKAGLGGAAYVSAKRTHRFRQREQDLSDCEANRCNRNISGFSVGSFSKTNPPGGLFSLAFGSICTGSERSRDFADVKMLRTCRLRECDGRCLPLGRNDRRCEARRQSGVATTQGLQKERGRWRCNHGEDYEGGVSRRCAGGNLCPLLVW